MCAASDESLGDPPRAWPTPRHRTYTARLGRGTSPATCMSRTASAGVPPDAARRCRRPSRAGSGLRVTQPRHWALSRTGTLARRPRADEHHHLGLYLSLVGDATSSGELRQLRGRLASPTTCLDPDRLTAADRTSTGCAGRGGSSGAVTSRGSSGKWDQGARARQRPLTDVARAARCRRRPRRPSWGRRRAGSGGGCCISRSAASRRWRPRSWTPPGRRAGRRRPGRSPAIITLARARDRRRVVDLRPLVGTPVGARWPVTEVALVESHPHPRGANYEVVETVSLGEARTMG